MDDNSGNVLQCQQEQTTYEWFCIYGHDKLKKKIVRPGWGERPVTGQLVTVKCVGNIDDKTEIDKHDRLQLVLGDGDFIPAFDLCILHMYKGEVCEVFTDARYAYGLHGREPDVPGDVSVTYRIELVDFGDLPEFPLISIHTIIQLCNRKIKRANLLTSRKEYLRAIFVHRKTLHITGWWSTRFVHTSPPEEFQLLTNVTVQCNNLLYNAQMQCWEEYRRTLDNETVAQLPIVNPLFPFWNQQMPVLLLEMEHKLLEAGSAEARRGGIEFRCLTPGPEERRPLPGQLVTVKCVGYLEDGTQIDKHERLQLVLMDCEFVEAFDHCLRQINKGDAVELNVCPQFAYGSIGRDPDVPGNMNIKYIIQLLDIENQREFPVFTVDHIVQLCNKKRERGNYYFKQSEFGRAVAAYSRSRQIAAWWFQRFVTELPAETRVLSDLTVLSNNNLAAAFIKMKLWNCGLQCCVGALAIQPRNVKSLYRHAQCLAGMGHYSNAIDVLHMALMFEPGNKGIEMQLSAVQKKMSPQPAAKLTDRPTVYAKTINLEIERIFHDAITVNGKTARATSDDNQPDIITGCPEPGRAVMPCGHVIGPQSLLEHIFKYIIPHPHLCEVTCPKCPDIWDFRILCGVACLDAEEEHELERLLTDKYIWSKNVKNCKGCGAYVDLEELCEATGCRMVRCPVCTKRAGRIYDFCSSCMEEWKDGGAGGCGNATCEISNQSIYERLQANCDNVKDIGGVMCPAIRACPRCLALMEHVQNCRHVQCTMCVGGYWYCFVCLRPSGHYPTGGPFPANACAQPLDCVKAAPLQTPDNYSQNYP